MQEDEFVSVIITTKDEEDVIERLIRSVKSQTFKKIEIILVDNNSQDRTVEIASKMKVRVEKWGPERSAQRNFGAKLSKGTHLFFLDADMELSSGVLKECVEVCRKDKRIGGVAIPEESIVETFWEKVKAFERSFYNKQGDDITDAARFFKKEVFEIVKGYDETITGPEDWDLSDSLRKKGYKIGRVKSIIYHYERINSLLNLARKKFYYGLKSHRYLSKQKIPVFSQKTIYFLRPVFYKNFDKMISHPILAIGMIIMLTLEIVAGASGYLVGKFKKL